MTMKTATQPKAEPAKPVRSPELQAMIDAITERERREPKREPAKLHRRGEFPVHPAPEKARAPGRFCESAGQAAQPVGQAWRGQPQVEPAIPVRSPVPQFTSSGTAVPVRLKSTTHQPCPSEVRLVPPTPVRAGGPRRVKSSWPIRAGRAEGSSGEQDRQPDQSIKPA
jgi:hypothetical protein